MNGANNPNFEIFEIIIPRACTRVLNLVKAYGEKEILNRMLEEGFLKIKSLTPDTLYNFESFLEKEAEEKEQKIVESIPDPDEG